MQLAKYYDTMLYQGLYFDVDYDNADYNQGADMLMRLRDTLPTTLERVRVEDVGVYLDGLHGEPMMVFSGGKGFHLVHQDWSSTGLPTASAERYREVSQDNQNWNKDVKDAICAGLREDDSELLLDWEVTRDPRRIIRLPGTVHGKTLRVCKIVTEEDFEFSEGSWKFNADSPIA